MVIRTVVIITATLVLLCGTVPILSADDVSFHSSVDNSRPGVGERFTLTFVLENAGMGGGKEFSPPDLSDFYILSGPNQSSSIQFINGSLSSSVTYSYILQPKGPGKHRIPSATVEVDRKKYSTQAIELEVVQGSSSPGQPQDKRSKADDDIADNIFLKAVVDKKRVLQGEQINLTFKLYTRVSVNDYGISKVPSLIGFWSEEVPVPGNIQVTTEQVNGRQFRVGIIKKIALFPTQAGELEITPMEVQTAIRVKRERGRDPFDMFFRDFGDPFGRTITYMLQSQPIKITVDPLPEGAPQGFRGAVGNFALDVAIDKNRVKADEPVNLTVTLSGTGNVKLLEAPDLVLPSGVDNYPPKVKEEINREGGVISGKKIFEYLLIPRNPGKRSFEPVDYTCFDPASGEYVTLTSGGIDLEVESSGLAASVLPGERTRSSVALLSEDIRFIKVGDLSLIRRNEFLFDRSVAAGMIFLPLAGFFGVLLFGRHLQRSRKDISAYRRRRASRKAQKGFKRVSAAMKTGSTLDFYHLLSLTLWQYLGDKLDIDPGEYSINKLAEMLAQKQVPDDVTGTLREVLETCARASYAPGSADMGVMDEHFNSCREAISVLDRVLK
jgi:hypothetical protein